MSSQLFAILHVRGEFQLLFVHITGDYFTSKIIISLLHFPLEEFLPLVRNLILFLPSLLPSMNPFCIIPVANKYVWAVFSCALYRIIRLVFYCPLRAGRERITLVRACAHTLIHPFSRIYALLFTFLFPPERSSIRIRNEKHSHSLSSCFFPSRVSRPKNA